MKNDGRDKDKNPVPETDVTGNTINPVALAEETSSFHPPGAEKTDAPVDNNVETRVANGSASIQPGVAYEAESAAVDVLNEDPNLVLRNNAEGLIRLIGQYFHRREILERTDSITFYLTEALKLAPEMQTPEEVKPSHFSKINYRKLGIPIVISNEEEILNKRLAEAGVVPVMQKEEIKISDGKANLESKLDTHRDAMTRGAEEYAEKQGIIKREIGRYLEAAKKGYSEILDAIGLSRYVTYERKVIAVEESLKKLAEIEREGIVKTEVEVNLGELYDFAVTIKNSLFGFRNELKSKLGEKLYENRRGLGDLEARNVDSLFAKHMDITRENYTKKIDLHFQIAILDNLCQTFEDTLGLKDEKENVIKKGKIERKGEVYRGSLGIEGTSDILMFMNY